MHFPTKNGDFLKDDFVPIFYRENQLKCVLSRFFLFYNSKTMYTPVFGPEKSIGDGDSAWNLTEKKL